VLGTLLGFSWLLTKIVAAQTGENFLSPPRRWTCKLLAAGTVSVLFYNLLAAINAQSAFDPASGAFRPLPHLDWLPHSCDRAASWAACWRNLALAGTFWATRDWLLAPSAIRAGNFTHTGLLPKRARALLLFLATNGFLLAVVALLQRLDHSQKLLWLLEPHINQTADSQFGPFAYRSNGLQYLALIWPLALGGWSMFSHAQRQETLVGSDRRAWLLLCALTMAVCPFLWQSRLAVVLNVVTIFFVAAILLKSHQVAGRRLVVLSGLAITIGLGLILNWPALAHRFSEAGLRSAERLKLWSAGLAMFRENWFWGTGPDSVNAAYFLYRPGNDAAWFSQMHCDWLQTLATYGVAGSVLWGSLFAALFCSPWERGKLPSRRSFVWLTGLGLAGCLAAAAADFPFQIYAVEHAFVVLAACFTALSIKK
jgi:hypothetical protein